MKKSLKNLYNWCQDHGIDVEIKQYGNPDYYNDGFTRSGLSVTFWSSDGSRHGKQPEFMKTLKRRKGLTVFNECYNLTYHHYDIADTETAQEIREHADRIAADAKRFEMEQHKKYTAEKWKEYAKKEDITLWFAVLIDEWDDDHGTGSHDFLEAVKMLEKYHTNGNKDAYIAVLDDNTDYCIEELKEF